MKFTFQPESRPLDGYTLKRGIARGGFGEVYYAISDAGKEVAVKLLQHNLDIELRGVRQCLNLRHPNLVTIFDVRTDADNDHWVVMEYIGGQTLEQMLHKQHGPLPIDQITCWLNGLCAGLSYLHDRGLVHRDVKPGNVFWDQGTIKLGDVGLSKFMSPSRRSAQTESVGTVYYMAPEVSYGKYGYEVDIYSVGVMLYEMLTGKLPFDGQSTGEILMKHLSEPPDLTQIPSQYRSAVAGALAKDPRQRTASAQQLLKEFHEATRLVTVPDVRAVPEPSFFSPQRLHSPRPREPIAAAAPVRTPVTPAAVPVTVPITAPIPDRTPAIINRPSRPPAADTPDFTWWVGRLLLIGVSYFILNTLFFRFSFWSAPWPFAIPILLCWPLIVACLQMPPTRGSGLSEIWQRDFPWLPDKLRDAVNRHDGGREWLRRIQAWDRTPIGYCAFRAITYLLIQTPLVVLALLASPGSTAAGVLILAVVMAGVYGMTLGATISDPVTARVSPQTPEVARQPGTAEPYAAQRRPVAGPGAIPHLHRPAPNDPVIQRVRGSARLAGLSGALNRAVLVTALIGAGTGFFSPLFGAAGSPIPDLGKLGLFTLTTLVAAWSVLITSALVPERKWTTGQRLLGLVCGVAIGSVAWWLSKALMVELPLIPSQQLAIFETFGRQALATNQQPTWIAYCVFFGLLMSLRRWWWHASPVRPALFRVSSVILTVLLSLMLPRVFLFPVDWAVTWGAVISCVVQLSAPWVPPDARSRRIAS